MKKKYLYLAILIITTVIITLFLSQMYKKEKIQLSYSYNNLNKITVTEFEEYMIEHPDTIIYISDKTNLQNNEFEKKLINMFNKKNIIENVIYIEKKEVKLLDESLRKKYLNGHNLKETPVLIVINDGKLLETTIINENSNANNIINYEVFE